MNSLIVSYTGKRGAGKTTTMVLDAYNYHLNGVEIYTNMRSFLYGHRIKEEDIIKLIETPEFKNCVLMIDEIQVLFDSRRSNRKENLNFLYFIQQIRKRNITLLYTTQFSRRVDIGIREHTDIEARPRMDTDEHGNVVCDVQYMDITETIDSGILTTERKVYLANDVFRLFDTNETIDKLTVDKDGKKKTKK